uniref:Uncharacterized protein n=1 Tax=Micrurus spixii TaxID=129469 RepID=A0A2D4NEW0_9SAUR
MSALQVISHMYQALKSSHELSKSSAMGLYKGENFFYGGYQFMYLFPRRLDWHPFASFWFQVKKTFFFSKALKLIFNFIFKNYLCAAAGVFVFMLLDFIDIFLFKLYF